jgi:hypothetical protein
VTKKRNYKDEYEKFQASEKSKSDRAKRNTNRRRALKEGKVHKGDDKEVDHVDGNPQNNSKDNLRVINRSKNRAKH